MMLRIAVLLFVTSLLGACATQSGPVSTAADGDYAVPAAAESRFRWLLGVVASFNQHVKYDNLKLERSALH